MNASNLKEVKNNLREELAALEHEQWGIWTRYMIRNFTKENVDRWKKQMVTPYKSLSEKEKRSDRVGADRVLELFERLVRKGRG